MRTNDVTAAKSIWLGVSSEESAMPHLVYVKPKSLNCTFHSRTEFVSLCLTFVSLVLHGFAQNAAKCNSRTVVFPRCKTGL